MALKTNNSSLQWVPWDIFFVSIHLQLRLTVPKLLQNELTFLVSATDSKMDDIYSGQQTFIWTWQVSLLLRFFET